MRTEEPDVMQSVGSQRVRHNLVTKNQHYSHKVYHLMEETDIHKQIKIKRVAEDLSEK